MNEASPINSPEEPWRPSGKVVSDAQYQAWRDARELLKHANNHFESARQQAHKEGFETGESEGRQAILRVLIDTQARSNTYLGQLDREVAALVIALVERIIGETPAPERTLQAARQALSRLRKHKHIKMMVPPAEVERFREALADIPSPTGETAWFTVEADPHLAEGDCVIASELGYVRAGIDAQLENLRQTVFESLQYRREDD